MRAQVGDRIVVMGNRVGVPERDGEIVEVRGKDGAPPFVVRWKDSDQDAIFFPGSDATIQHADPEMN